MQVPVADSMSECVAAEPPVIVFEGVGVALIQDNESFFGQKLTEDPAALVMDAIPNEAELEMIEKLLHVESRLKSVSLPEGGSAFLDVCLGDEAHVSGGVMLSRR
jgi:hypothetical protein